MSPTAPPSEPAPPAAVEAAPATSGRSRAGSSMQQTAWLLRIAAVGGFLAAVMGVLVAPGLRGLANDRVVDAVNRVAWTLAYFMTGLLGALIVMAAFELSRGGRFENAWRGLGVSAAGLAVALAAPALLRPLPPIVSASLAVVTSFAVITAAAQGLRTSHTRAVASVMMSLGLAAVFRVVAWNFARVAGDAGNMSLYEAARVVATVAVALEGLGQVIAAAWLGTRSRFGGQALSSFAIALAWILTYSASRGASVTATPWEAAAHIALATAAGLPHAFGPGGLPVFLLAASILLAGVAAVQRGQVVAVVMALSLSLIGRGTFDVPLRALAAAAAAVWLMRSVTDERAVWHTILAARAARGPGGPRASAVVAPEAPRRGS